MGATHCFLAELKQWLPDRRETRAALLGGSGSTVFAVLNEEADGKALAKCARHELDPGLWAGMEPLKADIPRRKPLPEISGE